MVISLLAVFIAGAFAGSFLNLYVYRLHRGISVFGVSSCCLECGRKLTIYERIPVAGFFLSGGRCPSCQHRIPFSYPVTECWMGLLFTAAFSVFGFCFFSVLVCLFFSLLMAVWLYDWRHGIIPDRMLAVLLLLCPIYITFQPVTYSWQEYLLGIAAVSLPMFLLAYFFGGFGGGDIKLMAVCGLMLGTRCILLAAVTAILAGAAYAAFLLITKRAEGKSAIPFGPFLSGGMILSVLWGEQIIVWYLGLLGITSIY